MTNAVESTTGVISQIGTQFSAALGQQATAGRQMLDQATAWLAQHGVSFLLRLGGAIVLLLAGFIVVRALASAVDRSLRRSSRVDELLRTFICSVVRKTCWAVLIVVALGQLGVDVGPLVASLGVTGLVLGFAFKESLGSLAAGLMIALNHPFKVGDYVSLAGVEGAVTELNMMATVLSTADNKKVTVPNNAVWGAAITNFSALGKRRVDTQIGVAYGTDLAKARDIALQALAKVPGVLADPAPAVAVANLDDSEVVFNVRPWSSSDDYWAVYSAAQVAVMEAFEKAGFDVPFPQLDVHVRNS